MLASGVWGFAGRPVSMSTPFEGSSATRTKSEQQTRVSVCIVRERCHSIWVVAMRLAS